MTPSHVHCFFEQSGTFKRAFIQLGIPAIDYDIRDDFGETDVKCDLFAQIDLAYNGHPSIFDAILKDDLIIAFFPCIYFCETNMMYFCGTNYNLRAKTKVEVIDEIITRARYRQWYYEVLLKLFSIVEARQLKMVLENPYNAHHYLRFNFPYRPAVIDMNRRLHGDNVKKPTQYFFVNCKPAGNISIQLDKVEEFTRNRKSAAKAGTCSTDRSMIHPDYAHNFICDHILGIDSGHTQPLLF